MAPSPTLKYTGKPLKNFEGRGSKLRNRAQHRVATGLVIVSIGVGDEKHKEGDFEEDGFRDGDV